MADEKYSITIKNSKDDADMDDKWNINKGEYFKKIKESSNAKTVFEEAYLSHDIPEDINDITEKDCKYPHHDIKDDNSMVVSKAGCESALSRLHGQDIYEGEEIDHLKKHYKELELDMTNFEKKQENNSIEINVFNKIIEINEMDELTGRSSIKMALHEIYPNNTEYNLNGISWNRDYTENNMQSAINMPIVCQFLDENQEIPVGHGEYEVDEENDNRVTFKDSVVVGTITKAYIEDIIIDNITHQVLIGEGYLYNQRFPNFVNWLKDKINNEEKPVKSSIEIGAKAPNKTIIYDGGYKEQGRVPQIYDYTGTAILYLEQEADPSAVILEINNLKESNLEIKKENEVNTKVTENKTKKSRKSSTDKLKIKKTIELNELSYDDIRSIISDKFNDLIPKDEDEQNDNGMCYCCDGYWVYKLYPTRAIMQNWNDDYIYYSVPYSIDGNGEVILGQPIRVEPDWKPLDNQEANLDDDDELPISMDMSSMKKAMKNMSNMDMETNKKNNEEDETNSCNKNQEDNSKNNKGGNKDMDEKTTELNAKIEDLTKKVGEYEAKITELNSAVVEANKNLEAKTNEVNTMTTELNSLKEFKKEADEKAKKLEVNSYFENEIKKNGFTEVELNSLKSDYVDKMDLEGLKAKEAELCIKKVKELNSVHKESEINSTKTNDDLFVGIKSVEKSAEEDYSDLF